MPQNKGAIPWNKGIKMPEISGENHYLWKGGQRKDCPRCGKKIKKTSKYCRSCSMKIRIENGFSIPNNTGKTRFKKGHIPWCKGGKIEKMRGNKHPNWKGGITPCIDCGSTNKSHESLRCERCNKMYMVENMSTSWKGEDVGYVALHEWVSKHLGKPAMCTMCGKRGGKLREYHWSNVDHKYRRNLEDWQRLCVSCHKKYDFSKGLI